MDTYVSTKINTLNEKPLHAALKEWYSRSGDRVEVNVDGYLIDIVRKNQLIEIQTQSLFSLKKKLTALVKKHRVRVVLPIAIEKWIIRVERDEVTQLGRRKSPRRGSLYDMFLELVSIPRLMAHPNLSLEVLLIQEEVVRKFNGSRGWWRKGWVIVERRLLDVLERHTFGDLEDFEFFVPTSLEETFTTADIADVHDIPRWLAQKIAYCLREMHVIVPVGKNGNAIVYAMNNVPCKK